MKERFDEWLVEKLKKGEVMYMDEGFILDYFSRRVMECAMLNNPAESRRLYDLIRNCAAHYKGGHILNKEHFYALSSGVDPEFDHEEFVAWMGHMMMKWHQELEMIKE